MSNLTLQAQWHDAINQVETTEKILGGAAGNANLATKQLAENLLWLKQQLGNTVNESIKVGDTYTTTIDHANAAAVKAHHGYGTWTRFAEGRTLVGFSTKSADATDYKTIGKEFGANTHELTDDELPSHKHSKTDVLNKFSAKASEISRTEYDGNDRGITVNASDYDKMDSEYFVSSVNNKAWTDATEQTIGGNQSHNNIQPSRVVGHWLRTA